MVFTAALLGARYRSASAPLSNAHGFRFQDLFQVPEFFLQFQPPQFLVDALRVCVRPETKFFIREQVCANSEAGEKNAGRIFREAWFEYNEVSELARPRISGNNTVPGWTRAKGSATSLLIFFRNPLFITLFRWAKVKGRYCKCSTALQLRAPKPAHIHILYYLGINDFCSLNKKQSKESINQAQVSRFFVGITNAGSDDTCNPISGDLNFVSRL